MAVQREQVVRNAEKLASRGRIDAAIREYRKVLSESPDDVATLNRVGDLYARADRNDEAIKLYAQIAESYAEDGFFVKAIAIYKKIIKLDPTRLEVYENLASLYHRQGLLNEARTQYQVLADYYLKHDNQTSAIAIYERMVEVNPDDPGLRVKLADLYREMKLLDKALDEYRSIAETMLAAGAVEEAEQVYRRALDVDASDVGFITDAVLKLREAGQVGLAAHLLTHAVERNPEASRVARLVGIDRPGPPDAAVPGDDGEEEPGQEAAPSRREEAAVAPPADAGDVPDLDLDGEELSSIDLVTEEVATGEPPAAAIESASEPTPIADEPAAAAPDATPAFGEELELDLDEMFVLDFDEEEPPPDTQVRPPDDLSGIPAPASGFGEEPPSAPSVDPDLLERTAAEIQPERIRQEADLFTEAEVLSKYGLTEKAAERLAELLAINPLHVGALSLQVRFLLDGGAHHEAATAAGRLRTIADERSEVWLATVERLEEAGHRVTAEAVVPPVDETATLPGSAGDELDDLPELDVSGLLEGEEGLDEAVSREEPPDAGAVEPSGPSPDADEAEPAAPAPPPVDAARPARRAPPDIDSLLAEIASGVGSKRRSPRKLEKEQPPAAAAADAVPPPGDRAVEPAAEPVAESFDWLEEVERATGRIGPAGEQEADEFFDAEEDFFDLAAELEQELSREGELDDEELLLAQPREQTLEEIVDGFKRGVAETLSTEDHATHFDLGIAYREMGLLDEAIGEFQIAAKAPELLVSCCSMLGLSFLEKGLPELAVKWYQRGLEAPAVGEEDHLGLLYDLANAQLALGDQDAAYHSFVELYGINSHYRDVVARLEETRPPA